MTDPCDGPDLNTDLKTGGIDKDEKPGAERQVAAACGGESEGANMMLPEGAKMDAVSGPAVQIPFFEAGPSMANVDTVTRPSTAPALTTCVGPAPAVRPSRSASPMSDYPGPETVAAAAIVTAAAQAVSVEGAPALRRSLSGMGGDAGAQDAGELRHPGERSRQSPSASAAASALAAAAKSASRSLAAECTPCAGDSSHDRPWPFARPASVAALLPADVAPAQQQRARERSLSRVLLTALQSSDYPDPPPPEARRVWAMTQSGTMRAAGPVGGAAYGRDILDADDAGTADPLLQPAEERSSESQLEERTNVIDYEAEKEAEPDAEDTVQFMLEELMEAVYTATERDASEDFMVARSLVDAAVDAALARVCLSDFSTEDAYGDLISSVEEAVSAPTYVDLHQTKNALALNLAPSQAFAVATLGARADPAEAAFGLPCAPQPERNSRATRSESWAECDEWEDIAFAGAPLRVSPRACDLTRPPPPPRVVLSLLENEENSESVLQVLEARPLSRDRSPSPVHLCYDTVTLFHDSGYACLPAASEIELDYVWPPVPKALSRLSPSTDVEVASKVSETWTSESENVEDMSIDDVLEQVAAASLGSDAAPEQKRPATAEGSMQACPSRSIHQLAQYSKETTPASATCVLVTSCEVSVERTSTPMSARVPPSARAPRRATPPREPGRGKSPLRGSSVPCPAEEQAESLFRPLSYEGESVGVAVGTRLPLAAAAVGPRKIMEEELEESTGTLPISHSGDQIFLMSAFPAARTLVGVAASLGDGVASSLGDGVDVGENTQDTLSYHATEKRETDDISNVPQDGEGLDGEGTFKKGSLVDRTRLEAIAGPSNTQVKRLEGTADDSRAALRMSEGERGERGTSQQERENKEPRRQRKKSQPVQPEGKPLSEWLQALVADAARYFVGRCLSECLRSWLVVYLRGETLLPSSADGPDDVFEVSPEAIAELLRRSQRPVIPVTQEDENRRERSPDKRDEVPTGDTPSIEELESPQERVLALLEPIGTLEDQAEDRELLQRLLHEFVESEVQRATCGASTDEDGDVPCCFVDFLQRREREYMVDRLIARELELRTLVAQAVQWERSLREGLAQGEDRRRLPAWVRARVRLRVDEQLGLADHEEREGNAAWTAGAPAGAAPLDPSRQNRLDAFIDEVVEQEIREETANKEIQRKRLRVLLSMKRKEDLRLWLLALEKELKVKREETETECQERARKSLRGGQQELDAWIQENMKAQVEMMIHGREVDNTEREEKLLGDDMTEAPEGLAEGSNKVNEERSLSTQLEETVEGEVEDYQREYEKSTEKCMEEIHVCGFQKGNVKVICRIQPAEENTRSEHVLEENNRKSQKDLSNVAYRSNENTLHVKHVIEDTQKMEEDTFSTNEFNRLEREQSFETTQINWGELSKIIAATKCKDNEIHEDTICSTSGTKSATDRQNTSSNKWTHSGTSLLKKKSIHVIKMAASENAKLRINVQNDENSGRDDRGFSETDSVTYESEYDSVETGRSITEMAIHEAVCPANRDTSNASCSAANDADPEGVSAAEREERVRSLRQQEAEIMEKLYKAWAHDPSPLKDLGEAQDESSRARAAWLSGVMGQGLATGDRCDDGNECVWAHLTDNTEVRPPRSRADEEEEDDDICGEDSRQFLHEEIDAELFEQYQSEDEARHALPPAAGPASFSCPPTVHSGGEDVHEDADEMRDWLEEYIEATVAARMDATRPEFALQRTLLSSDGASALPDCSHRGGRAHTDRPDAHSTTCVRGSEAALWTLECEEQDTTQAPTLAASQSAADTAPGGDGEAPTGEELLLQRFLQDAAARAGEPEWRAELLGCLRRYVAAAVERSVQRRRSELACARSARCLSRTWSQGRRSESSHERLCAGLKEQAKGELREWLCACVEQRLDERLGPAAEAGVRPSAVDSGLPAAPPADSNVSQNEIERDRPLTVVQLVAFDYASNVSLTESSIVYPAGLQEDSTEISTENARPPMVAASGQTTSYTSEVSMVSSDDSSAALSVRSYESYEYSFERATNTPRLLTDTSQLPVSNTAACSPSSTESRRDVLADYEANTTPQDVVDCVLCSYRDLVGQRLSEILSDPEVVPARGEFSLSSSGKELALEAPTERRAGDRDALRRALAEALFSALEAELDQRESAARPAVLPSPSPMGTPRSCSAVGAVRLPEQRAPESAAPLPCEGDFTDGEPKKEREIWEQDFALDASRRVELGDAGAVVSPTEPPVPPPEKNTLFQEEPDAALLEDIDVVPRVPSLVGSAGSPAVCPSSLSHGTRFSAEADVAQPMIIGGHLSFSVPRVASWVGTPSLVVPRVSSADAVLQGTSGIMETGEHICYNICAKRQSNNTDNFAHLRSHLSFTVERAASSVGSVSVSTHSAPPRIGVTHVLEREGAISLSDRQYPETDLPANNVDRTSSESGHLPFSVARVASTVGNVLSTDNTRECAKRVSSDTNVPEEEDMISVVDVLSYEHDFQKAYARAWESFSVPRVASRVDSMPSMDDSKVCQTIHTTNITQNAVDEISDSIATAPDVASMLLQPQSSVEGSFTSTVGRVASRVGRTSRTMGLSLSCTSIDGSIDVVQGIVDNLISDVCIACEIDNETPVKCLGISSIDNIHPDHYKSYESSVPYSLPICCALSEGVVSPYSAEEFMIATQASPYSEDNITEEDRAMLVGRAFEGKVSRKENTESDGESRRHATEDVSDDTPAPSPDCSQQMFLTELLEAGRLSSFPFHLQSRAVGAEENEASAYSQHLLQRDESPPPEVVATAAIEGRTANEPVSIDIRVTWATVHPAFDSQDSTDDVPTPCAYHDSDVCMLERLSYLHSEDCDDLTHLYNLFDDKQVQVLDFNVDDESSTVSEGGVLHWPNSEGHVSAMVEETLRATAGCLLALPAPGSSGNLDEENGSTELPITVATSSIEELSPARLREGAIVMDDYTGIVVPGMQGYWFGEHGRVAAQLQGSTSPVPLHDIVDDTIKPASQGSCPPLCTSGYSDCMPDCGCPGDDQSDDVPTPNDDEGAGPNDRRSQQAPEKLSTLAALAAIDGAATSADAAATTANPEDEELLLAQALRQEQHEATCTRLRAPVATAASRAARQRPETPLLPVTASAAAPTPSADRRPWDTEQFDVESKAESDSEEEDERDILESKSKEKPLAAARERTEEQGSVISKTISNVPECTHVASEPILHQYSDVVALDESLNADKENSAKSETVSTSEETSTFSDDNRTTMNEQTVPEHTSSTEEVADGIKETDVPQRENAGRIILEDDLDLVPTRELPETSVIVEHYQYQDLDTTPTRETQDDGSQQTTQEDTEESVNTENSTDQSLPSERNAPPDTDKAQFSGTRDAIKETIFSKFAAHPPDTVAPSHAQCATDKAEESDETLSQLDSEQTDAALSEQANITQDEDPCNPETASTNAGGQETDSSVAPTSWTQGTPTRSLYDSQPDTAALDALQQVVILLDGAPLEVPTITLTVAEATDLDTTALDKSPFDASPLNTKNLHALSHDISVFGAAAAAVDTDSILDTQTLSDSLDSSASADAAAFYPDKGVSCVQGWESSLLTKERESNESLNENQLLPIAVAGPSGYSACAASLGYSAPRDPPITESSSGDEEGALAGLMAHAPGTAAPFHRSDNEDDGQEAGASSPGDRFYEYHPDSMYRRYGAAQSTSERDARMSALGPLPDEDEETSGTASPWAHEDDENTSQRPAPPPQSTADASFESDSDAEPDAAASFSRAPQLRARTFHSLERKEERRRSRSFSSAAAAVSSLASTLRRKVKRDKEKKKKDKEKSGMVGRFRKFLASAFRMGRKKRPVSPRAVESPS